MNTNTTSSATSIAGKQVRLLSNGWCFHLGELPESWQRNADESDFSPVTIPHDWSVQFPFSQEYSSGTGYVCGGIGWYRCHFRLPENAKGKRIRLSFDGVYKHSRVWVNGYYKGFHAYGYTPFSYDITDDVSFGERDNIIAVRVDHPDLADSRWFTGSGIERPVSVSIEEPVHTAEYGVRFSAIKASREAASVSLSARICNDSEDTAATRVVFRLYRRQDEAAAPVLETSVHLTLDPHSSCRAEAEGIVPKPALWSPAHPSLYILQTSIAVNDEPSYTADSQLVGIRTFSFDPEKGFTINGHPDKLRGVCLHEDCGTLGNAFYKEVWYRRLTKLKAMGCNAIRMSHNPHAAGFYELCDELGFFVMDEAFDEWEGPKNKWSTGHNVYPPRHEGYYEDFPACHKTDLQAMIDRGFNHPSIILWSIGNEIDYPNDPYCHPLFREMTGNNDANKPAAERMYNPDRPNTERLVTLAAMLASEVKKIDRTRPVTLAAAFPELSAQLGFLNSMDVAGYNYKEHLYEESHRKFPQLPFLGSENGHGWEEWKVVRDRCYISGQFLWTGIDYLGETVGWPQRGSMAGLLDVAGFEKPGYWRRQSFWSAEPMVHMVTSRAEHSGEEWTRPLAESWNYNPGETIEVRAYTNLKEADLFLNGQRIASGHRNDDADAIYFNVPFTEGVLSVRARGTLTTLPGCAKVAGQENQQTFYEANDKLCTVLTPSRLLLAPVSVPAEFVSDPEHPVQQLEVSVLDASGAFVHAGAYRIHVKVTDGTLLGLESGDLCDDTDYTSDVRSSCRGHLIVFVRRNRPDRPVTVSAECDELAAARITC